MQNSPQAAECQFKISVKAVVELSDLDAFEGLTDLAQLRNGARVSKAEITQVHGQGVEVGGRWDIRAKIRRKQRHVTLTVLEVRKPEWILVAMSGDQFDGHIRLQFKAKQQDLTQVRLDLGAAPKTLSGRLILHGVRLTQHRQKRRLTRGLRRLCRHLEAAQSAKG